MTEIAPTSPEESSDVDPIIETLAERALSRRVWQQYCGAPITEMPIGFDDGNTVVRGED